MATKTRNRSQANGQSPNPEPPPIGPGLEMALDVASIDPSPWQPRREFDPAELLELGATIRDAGLVQPIVVRQRPDNRVELIAGERRLRAAQAVGLPTIRCRMIKASDGQARELTVLENLQRRDLSAVEEALGFKALLDGDPTLTQEGLGRRLGKTQGHIGNRLALLALPKAWQEKIITRVIPLTHARFLGPWKDHPTLVAAIDKRIGERHKHAKPEAWPPALDDFEDLVHGAVVEATALCSGEVYDQQSFQHVKLPELSAEQRAELAIIKVRSDSWSNETEERATNVAAWKKIYNRLVAPLRAAQRERDEKRKAESRNPKSEPGKAKAPKPQTPEQRAEQLEQLREGWRTNFLSRLISDHVLSDDCSGADLWRLLLSVYALDQFRVNIDGNDLRQAMGQAPVKNDYKPESRSALCSALGELSDPQAVQTAAAVVAALFFRPARGKHPGEPAQIFEGDELRALGLQLGIDSERGWALADHRGARRAFFELHTADELAELARETGVALSPMDRAKGHVKNILKDFDAAGHHKMPAAADVLADRRPKETGKRRAK